MANLFRGLAFPFRKSSTALPASAVDDELIKQSLAQIILTSKGERVMRPDFGSNAAAFVFENNDLVLQETIRSEVMSAIAKYETRVIVRSVDVNQSDAEVIITVTYINVVTRREQDLVITLPKPEE
jgi:uncharacterized protein